MMKNDITYEYRVFTHRLIDVESMEVGICTSKVIKELKPKDKVNGRFFHTSDTDEWFFYWNNELQKLNLKGNSDVNAALAEVEKLIADANAAVDDAKKTATEAKNAAAEAKTAADAASAAVESIGEVSSIANAAKAAAEEAKTAAEGVAATASQAQTDAAEAKTVASEAKTAAEQTQANVDTLTGIVNGIKVPTNLSELNNDSKFIDKNANDLVNYYTKSEIDAMIGVAIEKTNTILNA